MLIQGVAESACRWLVYISYSFMSYSYFLVFFTWSSVLFFVFSFFVNLDVLKEAEVIPALDLVPPQGQGRDLPTTGNKDRGQGEGHATGATERQLYVVGEDATCYESPRW